MIETLGRIKRATLDLSVELGRNPSKEEIAYRVGISVSKLSALMKSAQSTISIETPTNQKDETSVVGDFIVDETHASPDSKVTNDSLLDDVQKMLNQLSPKEKDVLIMRYGLDNNGKKKTLDEIGNSYGVSRERIRQIENRAIAKLKKLCRNHQNVGGNLKNYI
jgi:RNA polymerase primary sigma factor